MTDNINLVLLWLKAFKNIWLPQNIPEDIHLLESITTKLLELEQLLKGKLKFLFIKKNQLIRTFCFNFQ
jgi:hypothetical protein